MIVAGLAALTCVLIRGAPTLGQAVLDGVYLGQDPPGLAPEKFMPGVISTGEHFEFVLTVSRDAKLILFTRRVDKSDITMALKQSPDGWCEPEPFEPLIDVGGFEQHFSPSHDRIYFSRLAPPPGIKLEGPPTTREEEAMLVGVWFMDRSDSGWSEPVYCTHGMYVTTTRNGTIYTTDIRGPVGIGSSKLVDGRYADLHMLGGGANEPEPGAHPCVDPEGTFVIFDSEREGGFGKTDLYVCFRQADGEWSRAVNLGASINSEDTDFCPSLSPDGRYLFYSSAGDIYWVDARVIESVRPEESD